MRNYSWSKNKSGKYVVLCDYFSTGSESDLPKTTEVYITTNKAVAQKMSAFLNKAYKFGTIDKVAQFKKALSNG